MVISEEIKGGNVKIEYTSLINEPEYDMNDEQIKTYLNSLIIEYDISDFNVIDISVRHGGIEKVFKLEGKFCDNRQPN